MDKLPFWVKTRSCTTIGPIADILDLLDIPFKPKATIALGASSALDTRTTTIPFTTLCSSPIRGYGRERRRLGIAVESGDRGSLMPVDTVP